MLLIIVWFYNLCPPTWRILSTVKKNSGEIEENVQPASPRRCLFDYIRVK